MIAIGKIVGAFDGEFGFEEDGDGDGDGDGNNGDDDDEDDGGNDDWRKEDLLTVKGGFLVSGT